MNNKEFNETIRKEVERQLGSSFTCEILEHGDERLTGLIIREKNCVVCPSIYLNRYLHEYQSGVSIDEILQDILMIYEANRQYEKCFGVKELYDYSNLKSKVILKVVNANQCQNLLKYVPYISMEELGLAAIFFVPFGKNQKLDAGFVIKNYHLKLWNMDLTELTKQATENTRSNVRFTVCSMESKLIEMLGEIADPETDDDSGLYVLTDVNTGTFGSTCMFITDSIAKFAKKQNCDLYIIPASTCELLLMRADCPMIAVPFLKETVKKVNRDQVSAEIFLSDDVFLYLQNENKIIKM